MRLFEFESVDMNKLDDYLAKLCSMIKKGQQERPEYYGRVAAGILTPKGKFVAKLNYPKGKLRVHAERAVIEEYQKYHGKIPEGSVMITTLSPCNETDDETAEGRVGMSCTDLINHHGFKHVYCGYKDPTQDADHGEYKEVITKNKQLSKMCKEFADTFLDKLDEVQFGGQDVEGNPLSQLKEKFPNLSTLMYFIPGLGQALVVADVASQVQMYNQAMDKIEKQYPMQTIQAVQQKVGDAGEEWETLEENLDENLMGFLTKPTKKKVVASSEEMRKYFEKEKAKEPPKHDTEVKKKPQQVFTRHDENFADGRHPEDKGDSKRYHVPTKGSVSSLRKFAKGHHGRAAELAHWMANMKSGHKK